MDPLSLLKNHLGDIQKRVERTAGKDSPATYLFGIWKDDLLSGKILTAQNEYLSPRSIKLKDLEKHFTSAKGSTIRPAVSRARRKLESAALVMDGYLLSLGITTHDYLFSVKVLPDPLATLRLIWRPYLDVENVVVACVKRIFFRVGENVYVRNITVDNDDAWHGCNVLSQLIGDGPAHPVRLYAPSGEVSAAFMLIDLLNHQLGVKARGSLIAPHYNEEGQNLIVLGSGIEEPHFGPPSELDFRLKNLPDGVEAKNGVRFSDSATETTLRVHVLVQRWRTSDNRVAMVIYGSHAAAIEEVARNLTHEEKVLRLVRKFPHSEQIWLRKRDDLECLFEVDLAREGNYFKGRDVKVVIPEPKHTKRLKPN